MAYSEKESRKPNEPHLAHHWATYNVNLKKNAIYASKTTKFSHFTEGFIFDFDLLSTNSEKIRESLGNFQNFLKFPKTLKNS
jgi:hypothetical protein